MHEHDNSFDYFLHAIIFPVTFLTCITFPHYILDVQYNTDVLRNNLNNSSLYLFQQYLIYISLRNYYNWRNVSQDSLQYIRTHRVISIIIGIFKKQSQMGTDIGYIIMTGFTQFNYQQEMLSVFSPALNRGIILELHTLYWNKSHKNDINMMQFVYALTQKINVSCPRHDWLVNLIVVLHLH